jgi:sugar phosphate isomerase/epimerase
MELGHEVAAGKGKANIPAIVKRLQELGYDGTLTIEREISGDEQVRDIVAAKELLESALA